MSKVSNIMGKLSWKWFVLIFAVVIFIVWMIFRKKDNSLNDSIPIVLPTNPDGGMSQQRAELLANQIYSAMSGFGTDEDVMRDAFSEIKCNDDFNKVYNAFGRRPYNAFGSPATSWFPSEMADLVTWLAYECDQDEYDEFIKYK